MLSLSKPPTTQPKSSLNSNLEAKHNLALLLDIRSDYLDQNDCVLLMDIKSNLPDIKAAFLRLKASVPIDQQGKFCICEVSENDRVYITFLINGKPVRVKDIPSIDHQPDEKHNLQNGATYDALQKEFKDVGALVEEIDAGLHRVDPYASNPFGSLGQQLKEASLRSEVLNKYLLLPESERNKTTLEGMLAQHNKEQEKGCVIF